MSWFVGTFCRWWSISLMRGRDEEQHVNASLLKRFGLLVLRSESSFWHSITLQGQLDCFLSSRLCSNIMWEDQIWCKKWLFFSGRLWCENDGTYYFQARWWTLPEETAEGRKPWHARRELFRSNTVDENEVVVLLLLLFLQLLQPNLMLYSYGLFVSTVPSTENLFLDLGGVLALFLFFSFAQIHWTFLPSAEPKIAIFSVFLFLCRWVQYSDIAMLCLPRSTANPVMRVTMYSFVVMNMTSDTRHSNVLLMPLIM